MHTKPSPAFVSASWAALIIGIVAYNVGLYNATMSLNEKGYYFTVLMYGLFSALLTMLLLTVGLWNATMTLSEKGFYAMSFMLSLFAAIAVQKNTRDSQVSDRS